MGVFDQLREEDRLAAQKQAPPEATPSVFSGLQQEDQSAAAAARRGPDTISSREESPQEAYKNFYVDRFVNRGMDPYKANQLAERLSIGSQLAPPIGVPLAGAETAWQLSQGNYGRAGLSALGMLPVVGPAIRRGVSEGTRLLAPNFADISAAAPPRAVPPSAEGVFGTLKRELGNAPAESPYVRATGPETVYAEAPTSRQLLVSGKAGFDQYRNSGATYTPDNAQELVDSLRTSLGTRTKVGNEASHEAVNEFADKVKNNQLITARDIDDLRLKLGAAADSGENAAMGARQSIYDHLEKGGDTTMRDAVRDYGAAIRTGKIEAIPRVAARSPGEDAKLLAETRAQVRRIEKNQDRGYTEAELAKIEAPLEPTGREKIADVLTQRGTGAAGQFAIPGLVGGVTTLVTGNPAAGAVAASIPVLGGNALRIGAPAGRQAALQEAANLVAKRSSLYERAAADAAAQPPVPNLMTPVQTAAAGSVLSAPARDLDYQRAAEQTRDEIAKSLYGQLYGGF